jgi:hypothetical protein
MMHGQQNIKIACLVSSFDKMRQQVRYLAHTFAIKMVAPYTTEQSLREDHDP